MFGHPKRGKKDKRVSSLIAYIKPQHNLQLKLKITFMVTYLFDKYINIHLNERVIK